MGPIGELVKLDVTPTLLSDRLVNTIRLRAEFPALDQKVSGHPLVYLDSAATGLKPRAVIDAVTGVYARDCGNVSRGVHALSQRATAAYESARQIVAGFIAGDPAEVVFVRGTTEAINLVAEAWARPRLGPGDRILVTGLEHHSNIVPWQLLCQQTGAQLTWVGVEDNGDVALDKISASITERTKVVAIAHVSNVLGTILPVREIAAAAHERGAVVVVDGAQAVAHLPVDVAALGCDFYAFSGHKLYGPTGIGVLWGRRELLASMPPYQGGGGMIRSVTSRRAHYRQAPHRFEAGTPHVAGAVGLGAAIEFMTGVGFDAIGAHERDLLHYATKKLAQTPGLRLYGTAKNKTAVLSFTMAAAHPHDIGTIADSCGVAIRTGHHCAQPLMDHFAIAATARASLGIYNTRGDIDALCRALALVQETFG